MPSHASAPIGVFDSGIGGLTVVREIMRQLPEEDIIYFGDTARVPYGPKSPETVTRYAHEITSFLQDQGVKNVVVACNTATAHAIDSLRDHFDLPITGVIEPGARAAVRASSTRRIGVVGTLGTVSSGAYERAIHSLDHDVYVTARACPLFVPFIEEGWLDHPAIDLVAHDYLASLPATGIDSLVLGCTHYPLIKPVITRAVGSGIRLIDSAEETAGEVARLLTDRGLRHGPRDDSVEDRPQHRFIASDVPEQFRNVGKRFLGAAIDHVETITLG
jgi:glutamate racemase